MVVASPFFPARGHRLAAQTAAAACTLAACIASDAAMAGEAYVSAGLPVVVVGYAASVNQHMGWRVDAGTTGSINKPMTQSGIQFDGKGTYNRLGLFGDFFPLSTGFRVTGGITVNRAMVDLKSRFDGSTAVDINGISVVPTASDYFNAQVKFPTVMPYIGLGWGHHDQSPGLGFNADVGVSFGKAKLNTDTNLVGQYGITQADMDAKIADLRDKVNKITLLPSANVGVSYHY